MSHYCYLQLLFIKKVRDLSYSYIVMTTWDYPADFHSTKLPLQIHSIQHYNMINHCPFLILINNNYCYIIISTLHCLLYMHVSTKYKQLIYAYHTEMDTIKRASKEVAKFSLEVYSFDVSHQ